MIDVLYVLYILFVYIPYLISIIASKLALIWEVYYGIMLFVHYTIYYIVNFLQYYVYIYTINSMYRYTVYYSYNLLLIGGWLHNMNDTYDTSCKRYLRLRYHIIYTAMLCTCKHINISVHFIRIPYTLVLYYIEYIYTILYYSI